MKPDTAFIRADGRTVLDAVTTIHSDFAMIIHPGHTKYNHPLRFNQPVQQSLTVFALFLIFALTSTLTLIRVLAVFWLSLAFIS